MKALHILFPAEKLFFRKELGVHDSQAVAGEVVTIVEYARTQAHINFEHFSPFNETDCDPPEGPRIDPDEAPKVLEAVARRLKMVARTRRHSWSGTGAEVARAS
jgi:hypothetical protein